MMARDFDPRDHGPSHRDREHLDYRHSASGDPKDPFVRDMDLPHGLERESVRDRDRAYTLNGSEARTLATAGAFRLISEMDLHGHRGDVRHLEKQGLVERVPVGDRERAITLTDRGRALLERHRDSGSDPRQTFYSGANKARERSHDVHIYRAYRSEVDRLQDAGASIARVQLDRELKGDYQRFLQERNRGDRDSEGRPDRAHDEVAAWAREHDLPYFDEQVHFPDVRIEYRDVDGDVRHLDIEVTTEHYRGAHGAATTRSGFTIHTSGNGSRGGRFADPRTAEDFL
jgi:DNA-binding MarR family transcriptional regulator